MLFRSISQEVADTKFEDWKTSKDAKITGKTDGLSATKDADKAVRMAREVEINNARAAAIAKRNVVEEEVVEAPIVEEAPVAEAVIEEAPEAVVEEAPVAATVVEETPVAQETPATEEEAPKAE